MAKVLRAALTFTLLLSLPAVSSADPDEDLKLYRDFYLKRFPGVPLEEFANGIYAIDQVARESWLKIADTPPYAADITRGETLWNSRFGNGKSFADCFDDDPAQVQNYPRWDSGKEAVVTLELAINDCLRNNGEETWGYLQGKIASLIAYMSDKSRGQVRVIEIPWTKRGARNAYNQGKKIYLTRRGQLNFSCATCHLESAGLHFRSDTISPSLGQTTGWPSYRTEWKSLGTLHRRFIECTLLSKAKPFRPQSEEYRNLEYFLTHMSNGVPLNGPSYRH